MVNKIKFAKRGQLTIWIILAIVLVASMVLFFSVERGIISGGGADKEISPEGIITSCVRENTQEIIDQMIEVGGFIDNQNVIRYENKNITYICKHSGNYKPCVNQYPRYLENLKIELINHLTPRVEECFDSFVEQAEKRNYDVEIGVMNISVDLGINRIFVDVKRDLNIEKDETSRQIKNIEVEIISPLYDLANIAIEIGNNEAKYCNFEYAGYMILFPRWKITRDAIWDSNRIYTITDNYSDKKMTIAIRSCAVPAGI